MRLLVYTLLRVGLILGCAGLLYLAGLRSWLLWAVAILMGALLAFLLLREQTVQVSRSLGRLNPIREERPRLSRAAEADAAYEDAAVEAGGSAPRAEDEPSAGGGEQRAPQQDAVAEGEQPGPGEHGDELPPARP